MRMYQTGLGDTPYAIPDPTGALATVYGVDPTMGEVIFAPAGYIGPLAPNEVMLPAGTVPQTQGGMQTQAYNPVQQPAAKNNTLLYIGIGVIGVILLANLGGRR